MNVCLICCNIFVLTIPFFVQIFLFRLFLAAGISEPLSSSSCASALRKVCEDASAVMHEPSNLEILMWIGEVNFSQTVIHFNICVNLSYNL